MRILFSERKKSKNQIGLDNRFKGLKPIKTGRQTRDRVRRVAFLKQTLHSGDPVHLHAPPPGPQLPEGSGGILAAGAPGWLFPQAPPGGGCGGQPVRTGSRPARGYSASIHMHGVKCMAQGAGLHTLPPRW